MQRLPADTPLTDSYGLEFAGRLAARVIELANAARQFGIAIGRDDPLDAAREAEAAAYRAVTALIFGDRK